ncbi:hypothetical protein ABZ782_36475 [Streptomyces asoensis]|uniref:hypothetical protein n=1 Tax=Streptomyces asoensis TaxID=249586 RepID=UPI0033D43145
MFRRPVAVRCLDGGRQYLYLRYRHGEGCVEWHSGPDDDADTSESWNEGLSRLLIAWDDGSGNGVIKLEDFLAAAGLRLAPDASVSWGSGTRSGAEPDDEGGFGDSADASPVLLRDDRDALAQLGGPEGGNLAAGSLAEYRGVEALTLIVHGKGLDQGAGDARGTRRHGTAAAHQK